MEKKELDLEKEYLKFQEKYGLPDLVRLSEDFDVNKIDDKEPTYLIRAVRRSINEKISAYLHLLELLINPNNPPLFVLSAMRNIDVKEKESIREMYKELSRMQIEVMRLDTVYDEKKEAAFVVSSTNQWQKLKPKVMKIIDKLSEGLEKEEISKERGYFG
jgi:hypothetical protein